MVGRNRQSGLKKLNVLLVAKSGSDAELVCQLRALKGVKHLFVAEDIADALKVAAENHLDLIVSEFYMNDGTILEFLQNIHTFSSTRAPVLALVEKNAYTFSLCAYRKGVTQVIVKDEAGEHLKYVTKFIQRLRDKQASHLTVMQSQVVINNAIIGIDKDLKIKFLNAYALGFLGKSFDALMNQSLLKVMKPLDKQVVALTQDAIDMARQTLQPQPIGTFKLSEVDHDLAYSDVMLYPTFIADNEIMGYILNFRERAALTSKMPGHFQQHEFDALTGLLNREAFLSRLEHTLTYCERYQQNCAVIHIDVDGFKSLNDALGHRLADELLKQIAKRIKSIVRSVDILSRIGADEFNLLLTRVDKPQDAARVADKLMRAFRDPFIIEQHQQFASLTMGIAWYPLDAQNYENMVQCASIALALAKEKGRKNYQFYKAELTRSTTSIVALANELHLALERDEFELFLQAQVSARDQSLVGFEALIRWKHPEKGYISPALFIPIAEQMGMINEIGQWVLAQACRHIITLNKLGYDHFRIAVNISIQQFMREHFIDELSAILDKFKVSPTRLELEITESIFAHDKQEMIRKLETLSALGFKIVMDDFGTGYSSLSYIKDLPLQGIKIDRAFVVGLGSPDHAKYRAIVSAIIILAQQLNLKTFAEGIETAAQGEWLRELGCDYFQGFLFAKPAPINDVVLLLEALGKDDGENAQAI